MTARTYHPGMMHTPISAFGTPTQVSLECDHKHRTLNGARECGLTQAQIDAGDATFRQVVVSDDGGKTFSEMSVQEERIRNDYERQVRMHRHNGKRAAVWRSMFGGDPPESREPRGMWAPVNHPGEWAAYLAAYIHDKCFLETVSGPSPLSHDESSCIDCEGPLAGCTSGHHENPDSHAGDGYRCGKCQRQVAEEQQLRAVRREAGVEQEV